MLPTSVISICLTPRPVLLTWISHGNIKRPAGQYTFPRTHSLTHTQTVSRHSPYKQQEREHRWVDSENHGLFSKSCLALCECLCENVCHWDRKPKWSINERVCVCVCERFTEGWYLFQMSCYQLRAGLEAHRSCSVMVECHRLDDLGGTAGIFPSPCFVFEFKVQN